MQKKKEIYKKTILKVWLFGFLSDFIGAVIMILGVYVVFDERAPHISDSLFWNPFDNTVSFIWTLLAVVISMRIIYLLNYKVSLKNVSLTENEKKKISWMLAIFTAPYLMFIPTKSLY